MIFSITYILIKKIIRFLVVAVRISFFSLIKKVGVSLNKVLKKITNKSTYLFLSTGICLSQEESNEELDDFFFSVTPEEYQEFFIEQGVNDQLDDEFNDLLLDVFFLSDFDTGYETTDELFENAHYFYLNDFDNVLSVNPWPWIFSETSIFCLIILLLVYNVLVKTKHLELIKFTIFSYYFVIIIENFRVLQKFFLIDFDTTNIFYGTYSLSSQSFIFKQIFIVFFIVFIFLYLIYNKDKPLKKLINEVILLNILLLNALVLVSINDLFILFMLLEGVSIVMYIIIALNKNIYIASESSLKYFLLSSFASSLSIFGLSLFYAFFKTTNIDAISLFLSNPETFISETEKVFLFITSSIFLFAFFFKLTAAPFHFWAPEIYGNFQKETLFLFLAPIKLLIIMILIKLNASIFGYLTEEFLKVYLILGIFSILIGGLGALFEEKVNRFLTYSSINQIGFILLNFSNSSIKNDSTVLIYVLFYLAALSSLFFSIRIFFEKNGKSLVLLKDLRVPEKSYFEKTLLIVPIASMAGMPPFFGFFAKFNVLMNIFVDGFFNLAGLIFLLSILSAFYYVKLMKNILFDKERKQKENKNVLFTSTSTFEKIFLISINLLILVAFFYTEALQANIQI